MGYTREPDRFPSPLFLFSLGRLGACSLGNYTERRHIKCEMKSSLDEPSGRAGRALGAGCAWLWSCGGTGRLLVRRCLCRRQHRYDYRAQTAQAAFWSITLSGMTRFEQIARCALQSPRVRALTFDMPVVSAQKERPRSAEARGLRSKQRHASCRLSGAFSSAIGTGFEFWAHAQTSSLASDPAN